MYKPKVFRQLNKTFINSTEVSAQLVQQLEPLINQLTEYIQQQDIISKYQSVNRINKVLSLAQKQLQNLKVTNIQNDLPLQFEPEDLFECCPQYFRTLNQQQKQIAIQSVCRFCFKIQHEFNPLAFLIQKMKQMKLVRS